jgi:DNA-binding response OmpR family regulator
MPKVSGDKVARAIRDADWGRSTTIIAITGWPVAEAEKHGTVSLFDAYLLKPVEFDALLTLLQRCSTPDDVGTDACRQGQKLHRPRESTSGAAP